MKIRPIEPKDAPLLVELWNQAATYDPLNESLLVEKSWGDDGFDPSLALVADEDGNLRAMAVGVCRQSGDRTVGFLKLVAVAPTHQRQGLGSRLIREIEHRCEQLGANAIRVGESAPNYLVPGVDRRYEAAIALFDRQHYQQFAETCNMVVDLPQWQRRCADKPREEPNDSDLEFRRAVPEDERGIRALLADHWPSWWGEVSVALANKPPTLFLACAADSVVAFAAHDANNLGTGWFGPMGTLPAYRGRGIGGRLLTLCLDEMASAGLPTATIPWVGPVDFYANFAGAKVARTFVRFEKALGVEAKP